MNSRFRRCLLLSSAGALCAISLHAQQPPQAPPAADPQLEEQKAKWMKEQSNWGRWGKEDELGALNLITKEKREKAMALAKTGTVVSLTRKIALAERNSTIKAEDRPGTAPFFDIRFRTYGPGMPAAGYSFDMQEFAYHGSVYTHLDALCHISYEGKLYNGYPHQDTVNANTGCSKMGIQALKEGIVTRGVLIDLPRLRGVAALSPNDRLRPDDVIAWEKQAHVRISAGDAVFLYTGWKEGGAPGPAPNYDPSMVTFFKSRDVALVGADRVSGDHQLTITALGVYLIDNCDLGPLAETAARLNRWEFMLVVAPIPTPGATGSIVNPLAMF